MLIDKIKITPLGGVGEIGALNCMVYETADEAIVVDCGTMFPDQESLGVDLVIPDLSYLDTIRHKLKAVVLTHGHEDHCGAIPFLLQRTNIPVHATPFTHALIRQKLTEYPLLQSPRLLVFQPGQTLKIGRFQIETLFVNHSIIDACALAIHTLGGTLVHLTDWKIDKTPVEGGTTDIKGFSALGKKGVLALFSDSTNIEEPGWTLSEREVSRRLTKICSPHTGRIIVTLFASNIHRVQTLIRMAKKLGRHVALAGRSMHENTQIARELGRLTLDGIPVVDVDGARGLPPRKVLLLVTGSQGEPRSVMTKMAIDNFKPFKIQKGDLVLFSSKIIPGNEKNTYAVINNLCRLGARVLYEDVHDIHASGHAHQEELSHLIHKLKPRYFIPIHGEYRHLIKHARLARECGVSGEHIHVIENGTPLLIDKKKMTVLEKIPTGRVFVDGRGVGDVSHPVMRDRQHLAQTGLVICVVMIDRVSGEILRGPELISRGFTSEIESKELLENAKKAVSDTLDTVGLTARTDLLEVHEEVRLSLQRFFRRELDRKPVVIPVIQEV